MKGYKTFTQYSEKTFSIGIYIGINGNIRQKSKIRFYGKDNKRKLSKYNRNNKKYFKQWRKNNPDKLNGYRIKHNKKRNSWGIPNPFNEWFTGSHLHHLHIINHLDCIYIPVELHKSIWHSHKNKDSMNKINKVAFEYLEKQ